MASAAILASVALQYRKGVRWQSLAPWHQNCPENLSKVQILGLTPSDWSVGLG